MANALAFKALERLETAVGSKRLGEIFLELGYITEAKLQRALDYQAEKGGKLGQILASLGYISRRELYEGLARHFSLPFEVDTAYIRRKIDINLAVMLTRAEMIQYKVIPVTAKGKTLTILTSEPYNQPALEFLKRKFGIKKVNQIVMTDLNIRNIAGELYRDNILDMSNSGRNRNPGKDSLQTSGRQLPRRNQTGGIKQVSHILPVPEDVSELVVIKRGKQI